MIKLESKEIDILMSKFSFFKKLKVKPKSINSLNKPAINGLHFLFKDSNLIDLNNKFLLVLPSKKSRHNNFIFNKNPKLLLAKILELLYKSRRSSEYKKYNNNIYISKTAQIDENVKIDPNTIIGDHVFIKKNCFIGANSLINSYVNIGCNVNIQSNCSIGTDGFSYTLGDENIMLRHLGGLIIKENVDIGPQVNISSGQIDPTIIHKEVKVDGQVYIGHNANVGSGSFICAKSIIGGSAVVGKKVWVYPNSLITNKIVVGNKAQIGAGSIVLDNVKANETVVSYKAENIFSYQKKQIFLKNKINK